MGEEVPEGNSKKSLSDIWMTVESAIQKRPKREYFNKTLHPSPEDTSIKPKQVFERDLPIVKEAEEICGKAREEERLITKAENHLGNEVESTVLYIMGDLHLPATNPRRGVESKNLLFRAGIEVGPRSRGARREGKDWLHEEHPSLALDAFLQMKEAVLYDIGQRNDLSQPNKALMIIDLGDRVKNDAGIADLAGTAILYEELRREAEERLREASGNKDAKVYETLPQGNHDADIINFRLDQEKEERKLHGTQIFFQEIGKEHALLVLNTNFSSEYWNHYFEIEKKSAKSDEDKEFIAEIKLEIELQKKLVQKAVDSGRKLIVAGHQMDQIERIIDLPKSKVTHILSGHVGPEQEDIPLEIQNIDGQNIRSTRVVGALGDVPGWEKGNPEDWEPVGFAVEIGKDESGQETVKVDRLKIPQATKDLKYLV